MKRGGAGRAAVRRTDAAGGDRLPALRSARNGPVSRKGRLFTRDTSILDAHQAFLKTLRESTPYAIGCDIFLPHYYMLCNEEDLRWRRQRSSSATARGWISTWRRSFGDRAGGCGSRRIRSAGSRAARRAARRGARQALRGPTPCRSKQIQDVVEQTLIAANHLQTARAYIVYREQHAQLRQDRKTLVDVAASINEYLDARRLARQRQRQPGLFARRADPQRLGQGRSPTTGCRTSTRPRSARRTATATCTSTTSTCWRATAPAGRCARCCTRA